MSGIGATYRAPLRIDLAGGTLDIWPLYLLLRDPVTINLAISRYATVCLRRGKAARSASPLVQRIVAALGRKGLIVEHEVACPRGSGLGGSSALAVALVRALLEERGEHPTRERVFRLVRDIEAQQIETPTGDQDYLAALHGGLSVIRFRPGGHSIERLDSVADRVAARLCLFYTGVPRFSGINNWAVFRAVFDGSRAVRARLRSIASIASDVAAALAAGDLDSAGRLVDREWRYRRGLARGITTPAIERAFALGKRHGALAGKVCGAGGGGCAFLYAREGEAPLLSRALAESGFQLLPFRLARRGLHRSRLRELSQE